MFKWQQQPPDIYYLSRPEGGCGGYSNGRQGSMILDYCITVVTMYVTIYIISSAKALNHDNISFNH